MKRGTPHQKQHKHQMPSPLSMEAAEELRQFFSPSGLLEGLQTPVMPVHPVAVQMGYTDGTIKTELWDLGLPAEYDMSWACSPNLIQPD